MKNDATLSALALGALLATTSAGQAACPTPFRLSGKIDQLWKDVTNNQWNNMLPKGWIDNGFHFYDQVRERGPANGVNTPSDLESEVLKSDERPERKPNRWEFVLPITNSRGEHLRAVYDYTGKTGANCELVTFTF
jgi:hypothetical protein